jgi:hypothetical protein
LVKSDQGTGKKDSKKDKDKSCKNSREATKKALVVLLMHCFVLKEEQQIGEPQSFTIRWQSVALC